MALSCALVATLGYSRARAADAASPTPAPAVTSEGSASQRVEAEAHFLRGLELARQQDWDAALAEFLTSRELYATRSATRNAAIAQQKLGRYAESYELYQILLREFSGSMSLEEQDLLRRELADAAARTAEVDFDAREPGTSVVLDGKQLGTTPLAGSVRVNPGTHVARLSKDGFQSSEQTFTIAAGKQRLIATQLRPLSNAGRLVVREAEGRQLSVLVDGAPVGKTPWSGALSSGVHAIQLRGEGGLGTAPGSATVRSSATVTLVLRAQPLDASLRIEPVPSTATVYLDGVAVGAGIWQGELPSGSHRIEATAPGHWLFRRQVALRPGKRELVRAQLERDSSNPLWRNAGPSPFYAELAAGALLATSLRAEGDSACRCPDRSPARGLIASARLGYTVWRNIGLEASLGMLSLWQRFERTLEVPHENATFAWKSTNYDDSTRLTGPWFGVGGALRMFEQFPVTARLGAGASLLRSNTSSSGTFAATPPGQTRSMTRSASIPEEPAWLVTPFISSELRAGYRLNEYLSADIGVALMLMLPEEVERIGSDDTFGEGRTAPLPDFEGDPAKAGVLKLPDERIAGPFLALAPSVGVRLSF